MIINIFVLIVLKTTRHRLGFILPSEKLCKSESLFDDFIIKDANIDIDFQDEINIVMRGSSLKNYWSEINHELPTFYVNMWSGKFDNSYVDSIGNNVFFVTSADVGYKQLQLERLEHAYCLSGNVLHKTSKEFSAGSGLGAILSLHNLSEKINIYGWDSYIERDLSKLSYRDCVNEIISPAKRGGGQKIKTIQGYYPNTLPFIFTKIINIHYANRISKMKKYNIRSNLSSVSENKRLISNIEKLFYS